MPIESSEDLNGLSYDVLISVSGSSAKHMAPIADSSPVPFHLQFFVMYKGWDQGYFYLGLNRYYFKMFGRPDGTLYYGGFKDLGQIDRH